MFTIQKMIDSRTLRLLFVCFFPLCLAIPVLSTAASSTNLAARADDLLLPVMISSVIDPPEIPFPKPPPAYQGTTAMEQKASVIDPPEIPFPKPPPACQGTTAMEQKASVIDPPEIPFPKPPPAYQGTTAMEQTA